MTTNSNPPKRHRLRPATRELCCSICGQTYTYPAKGENATRRLCVECASLPPAISQSLMQMGRRIRDLEKEVKSLSEKCKPKPTVPNGENP